MKCFLALFFLLFILPTALAQEENLYLQNSLELEMEVIGSIDLVAESGGASLEEASVRLLLFPEDNSRQTLVRLANEGDAQNDQILYSWKDGKLERKEFGYVATINTISSRQEVLRKIPFPLSDTDIKGYKEYTNPTATIDSNNPKIKAKAQELAGSGDDLFKVVFNIAEWVERSVNYDLNTLTAGATQKASWVLENKQGVCDEMTGLFIAMARSLGIPARFVKGVSYTTSSLFSEPWQPHGWAEVYFPGVGWVSFDITFGEYGYIDVTHIKLRDGLDPSESDTKYEWRSKNVKLNADDLRFNIKVLTKGGMKPLPLELQPEILANEVGEGSYNIIKGIIKNKENYYGAITLQTAVPPEIQIIERNRRTIVLSPGEIRETYWLVKIPSPLDAKFSYIYPFTIYSEQNISATGFFNAKKGKTIYSQADLQKLTVVNEEKGYSSSVSLSCSPPENVKKGSKAQISCTIKNGGDTNLQQLNFCLDNDCETINVATGGEKIKTTLAQAETAGWNKVIVSAVNALIEKRTSVEFFVSDETGMSINLEMPEKLLYNGAFIVTLRLARTSIAVPQNVVVTLTGPGFINEWNINTLDQEQTLVLDLKDLPLGGKNTFRVKAEWRDTEGGSHSQEEEKIVLGEATGFLDKIKLFLNGIVNTFSS